MLQKVVSMYLRKPLLLMKKTEKETVFTFNPQPRLRRISHSFAVPRYAVVQTVIRKSHVVQSQVTRVQHSYVSMSGMVERPAVLLPRDGRVWITGRDTPKQNTGTGQDSGVPWTLVDYRLSCKEMKNTNIIV